MNTRRVCVRAVHMGMALILVCVCFAGGWHVAPVEAAPPPASFAAAASVDAGKYPGNATVADFNGDGVPDIAVANGGDSGVSILLGAGGGRYPTRTKYAWLPFADLSTAIDLNGDGKLDLIGVDNINNGISVLLGNGDGTFQPHRDTAVTRPYGIAVADVNGDANPDLAISFTDDSYASGVAIFLGNGDGTFRAGSTVSYPLGAGPSSIVLTDLSGDGRLDIITSDYGTRYAHPTQASIALGNGDGTFGPRAELAAGHWTITGDVNGDGLLDFIVLAYDTVTIGLGDGRGGIRSSTSQPISSGTGANLTLADVNRDGKVDIVTGGVKVLLGNGDGSFRAAMTYRTSSIIVIMVADVTGDGNPDILGTTVNSAALFIIAGGGDGSFPVTPSYATARIPSAVAVGDFNRDGIPDLVVPEFNRGLGVRFGTGAGAFGPEYLYYTTAEMRGVVVADMNGDGKPDIVTNGDATNVHLSNGDGTFSAPIVTAVAGFGPMVADFNGDGKMDLAVVAQANANHFVKVLFGNGDGTFQPPASYASADSYFPPVATFGDFNGDGKPDVAVTQYDTVPTKIISVLLNDGAGHLGPHTDFPYPNNPISLATGDMNGDGKTDIVGYNEGVGSVAILLGNGDGTLRPAIVTPNLTSGEMVVVADVNGDGVLDAVLGNRSVLGVLVGNGDGTFATPTFFAGGSGPDLIAVADLNGDGKVDIVTANEDKTVTLFFNTTPTSALPPPRPGALPPTQPPPLPPPRPTETTPGGGTNPLPPPRSSGAAPGGAGGPVATPNPLPPRR